MATVIAFLGDAHINSVGHHYASSSLFGCLSEFILTSIAAYDLDPLVAVA